MQWTAPQGDAYFNLAHQYIAAQLNITAAGGGSVPAEVQEAYQWATDYFQNNAPGEKPKGQDAGALRDAASILAAFNEGEYSGWRHCSELPEEAELYARLGMLD